MLTFVKGDKINGKTVAKSADVEGKLYIAFTDGTYTGFEAEGGGCDEDAYVTECGGPINLKCVGRYGAQSLQGLGIITAEEYAAAKDNESKLIAARQRAEFERLKAQFEPPAAG